MFSDGVVVSDHDDRSIRRLEPGEDLEYVFCICRIERPRGLVGQNHERLGHDGASERHALLFPTRELHGPMVRPRCQAEPIQGLVSHRAAIPRPDPSVQKRGLDVSKRGQMGNQVELLEHEADGVSPQPRTTGVIECADVPSGNSDGSARRKIEDARGGRASSTFLSRMVRRST